MTHLQRIATTLIVLALLLSACQPVMPEAQSAPEAPHGLRPDAPPYAVRGPYAVGVRHFTIEPQQEADRELNLTVWYPALDPDGKEADNTYAMTVEPGAAALWSTHGHAVPDAGADSSGGPYPLVVYSHAHTGFAADLAYLVEHLTSYGFVVLAVDHQDNQMTTLGQKAWQTEYQRPDEIRRQIAYADSLTAGSGSLEGMIDTERIGVAGFSLGGGTALAAGGARLDLGSYRAFCESNPDVMKTYVLGADCVTVLDNEAELADLAGLEEVPAGLWPDWSEDRVDAVVAMGPTVEKFGTTGIQSVHVPTLLMIGSADTIVGTLYTQFSPYQHLETERKSEVVFDNSGHMLFFTACQDAPDLVDLGLSFYCSDAVWDMDRAHDLVNHFTTAFLLAELKGDADAAAALAPENVTFPGIQYETTAYTSVASLPATTPALDAETVAEIETYVVDKLSANGIPGLALGVMVDGALVYEQGFGVASLDSQEPVTPETVFLLGETTMAPTAIAILQLVEQGLIDLDAPITEYLPYFVMDDEYFGEITVRHMLAHRSGIPDSGDAMADWSSFTPEFDVGSTERWVRSLADRSLLFRPGTGFEYSDIAYAILGDVIAKVTNQPFEVYMQEKLFAPLGMAHSTYLMDEVDPNLLASPHLADGADGRMVSDVFPYHRAFASANNLFSNVEDMARLSSAVLNGGVLDDTRILSAASHEAMWTAYSPTPYADYAFGTVWPATLMMDYGYGWFIGESNGHTVYTAFGRELGFNGQMILSPDGNLAVIAMGNGPVLDAYYASDIATDVMGMMIDSMAGAR